MIWARGQQRMAFRYALWSIKVNGRSAPNDMTFELYRIHLRPQAKSGGRHPSSLFGNATNGLFTAVAYRDHAKHSRERADL